MFFLTVDTDREAAIDYTYSEPLPESASPDSYIVRARIFYAGTHDGVKYDAKRIQAMAANFDPEKDYIPVQLEHTYDARSTVGRVASLWAEGDVLFGYLLIVGKEAVAKVRAGAWRKLSARVRYKAQRIIEVSITVLPVLEDAEILQYSKGPDADDSHEIIIEGGLNVDKEMLEKAMKDQKAEIEQAFGKKMDEVTQTFKAEIAKKDDKIKEYSKAIEEYKSKNAKMEEQLFSMQDKLSRKEDEAKLAKFRAEGKITPAAFDGAVDFYHSLSDEQKAKMDEMYSAMPAIAPIASEGQKVVVNVKSDEEKADAEADDIMKYSKLKNKE